MKLNKKEFFRRLKSTPKKVYFYCFLAVFLALASLLLLDYLSFFFHEWGHASTAVMYGFSKNITSITMNFTYIPYKIPYTNFSTLVPQQTNAVMPKFMLFYGVMFTFLLYAFIIFALANFKRIREDKKLEFSLTLTFLILMIRDVISNLFCGTDGFNLSCSQLFFKITSPIFYVLLLLTLGYFYAELLLFNWITKKYNPVKQNPTKQPR